MDARFPDRALTDPVLDGLSDAALRVFVNGWAYAVGQNTDAVIPSRALRLLHPDGARPDAAAELVAAGAWATEGDGWRAVLFADCQTSAAEVDRLRAAARERQQRSRARRDVTKPARGRDKPRDKGRDTGCDMSTSEPPAEEDRHGSSRVTDESPWPVVAGSSADPGVTVTRDSEPDSVTRDTAVTVTCDKGVTVQARQGKARQGQDAVTGAESFDEVIGESSRRCSVCAGPLSSPLDLADGRCAGCDGALHDQQARSA